MNQNISKESYTKDKKNGQTKTSEKSNKARFLSLFTIRNIIIYILTLLVSMAGGNNDLNLLFIPLGFSMGVAAVSYGMPSIIVIICSLVGTTIKYGFKALGINDKGQIKKGFVADLVVLKENPLEDIISLTKSVAVIHRGNCIHTI